MGRDDDRASAASERALCCLSLPRTQTHGRLALLRRDAASTLLSLPDDRRAMTSFVLKPHENRALPAAWSPPDARCPFCHIVSGIAPAYRLFEDEMVVAILGDPCPPSDLRVERPRLT